ncbi:response regulator [Caenimonas sedimenti]|uniref:histidine kinase n=1 Tax=Caenimonas sedimenti TaxID=2596921 RepID=A0A562ZWH4_9BURK|nr:response regulator [Caenimonas sedimenti]
MFRLAEPRTLAEQLRLVLSNVSVTVIPTFLLLIVLFVVLQDDENWQYLLAWCVIQMTLKLFCAWDARRRLRGDVPVEDVYRLAAWLTFLNALDGAIWGTLPWITLDWATIAEAVLVIATIAGVVGSALASLAAVPMVFLIFVSCMLLAFVPKIWLLGDPAYNALAIIAVLYFGMLLGQARNTGRAIHGAIRLRFENRELIERLHVETENARAAHRKAEDANLAKSKFLAAASHDLRQPIHAEGLFLGVLARSALTETQRQVLTSASAASQASAEMLDTLLDFSRIEAGVVQPVVRAFALQPVLNKIENDLAPQADAKGIVFRCRETGVVLDSDPALVEQILRNLVSNAIRYTESGGVLIGCRRRGRDAVLEVWDTGIGIAPSHQKDVFREFHQLGNAARERHKGLGLGLAIAQGMAQALGHPLGLQSQPGRGSVFRLRVPVAATVTVPPVQPAAPSSDTAGLPGVRVLFIDDDESVRDGMRRLLREWGCECDAAEGIDEALALVRGRCPDVVVSDYRLRGPRTGADAIAAVRAEVQAGAGRAIPALLITGDTAPDRLREAAASGVPLLHKPVAPTDLYNALARVLHGDE